MTKSELIAVLSTAQPQLQPRDVELAVKELLEQMSAALSSGQRIEVRGFGSFSLHYRPPRTGRNPKTGAAVLVPDKYVPHFKPGKELREKVNGGEDDGKPSGGGS
ncbi:MAG: integration host factor subunit beta [Candidatus Muproteobacteria bacterium RBG_16_62_13]|uniref:Integration host factor subunit beta n=1 Tax=Candidatus Muproteobacteria bacterium RBG_16_62_13 TaxID=1817756 RepID=A0A1F6T7Q6_9PROT|nr:MAG: integration host factor subunit beta [Candidatus Muproteobacteria bacterium RBG_16_62_13]